jgi:glutaredoxin-like protein
MEKLLKEKDEEYVRNLFEQNLKDSVELILFLEGEDGKGKNKFNEQYLPYTEEIVKEISSLSGKIKFTVYKGNPEKEKEYGVNNISSLFIEGKNTDKNLVYYGMPSGHEFSSLLEDIIDVSKGETNLAPSIKDSVRKISSKVEILVFVTPTCPYCPKAVRTAHMFAMENKLIRPEWSQKFGVYGVPKVIINEKVQFEGAVPENAFLNSVYEALGIKLII